MTTTKQSENPIRHRDWNWYDNHFGGATIINPQSNIIAWLPNKPFGEQGLRDPRDDAARIVACVNGCEGIPNPAAIKELLAAAQRCESSVRLMEALLELRAAIAAVEGK